MQSTESRRTADREEPEPPVTSTSAYYADGNITPTYPSRESTTRHSTRKSIPTDENPFNSVDDDYAEPTINHIETRRHPRPLSYRSVSSSSSRAYAQTHGPAVGHSGPSHPYTIYPQNTAVARTLSVSTSTTTPIPLRPSTSSRRPAHPYNMYTQNVEADMDDESNSEHSPQQQRFAVGFPGMQRAFDRRSDGDSMSIGAHSEQLPPYSEYPEDGAPTNVSLSHLQPPSQPQSSGPAPSPSPLPQRTPQSMSDTAPPPNDGIVVATDDVTSERSSQPAKCWREKSWKEKFRTRWLGMPLGWILLFSIIIIIVIIVVATAIASAVRIRHVDHRKSPPPMPSDAAAQ